MRLLEKIRKHQERKKLYNRDAHFVSLHNLEWANKEEIDEIKRVWPMIDINKKDLIYSMLYKKTYGFDPYFINDYQLGYILKKTNPYNQVHGLANKAMIDVYFNELPLPKVYIKCISGVIYDAFMNILSFDEGVERLLEFNQFVIKPTVSTGCGKGVKLVRLESNNKMDLTDLLHSYGRDFVVQELLCQNCITERLNPTSINSCRITSIFLNGRIGYSSALKIGKLGAVVDNWNSSYFVGVNEDGSLHDFGFDSNLNLVKKTDNDISFGGITIPNYNKMVQLVKKYHPKYFPNCGIVGWDIFIDAEGHARVIEVNLDYPGVVGEQLCSGTFFKDFRDDICSLLSAN